MNDFYSLIKILENVNFHPTRNVTLTFNPGSEKGKITLQAVDDWGDTITTTFGFSTFRIAIQKMEALLAESN